MFSVYAVLCNAKQAKYARHWFYQIKMELIIYICIFTGKFRFFYQNVFLGSFFFSLFFQIIFGYSLILLMDVEAANKLLSIESTNAK